MMERARYIGVVAGSFVFHLIIVGLNLSFGILYSELHTEFNVTQSKAAWVASLFTGLVGLAGAPAGFCVNHLGERRVALFGSLLLFGGMLGSSFVNTFNWFYISYGLIGGLGASLSLLPATTIITKTPEKNRTLLFAICSSGSAIGNLVLPPVLTYMISKYGWRGTFLLVSGLALHCLPASLMFDSNDLDQDHHSKTQRLSTNKTERESFKTSTRAILRSRKFLTFGISVLLCSVVIFAPATFMPDLMKEVSLSAQQIYVTVMAMGFGHLIGRLLPGVLERFFQFDLLNMYVIVLLAGSITSMAYIGVSSFIIFTTLAVLTGIVTGALLCLQVAIVALYLDKEHTVIGFGWLYTLEGITVILGIPLTGLIIDLTQTVRSGFVFTGGMMFLSLVVAFITKMLIKFEQKQQSTQNRTEQNFIQE